MGVNIDLTILLPAYNEEKAIGPLLREIREEVHIPHKILVVDNASTDRTAQISQAEGAFVFPVPTKGKGNAVREAISQLDTPFVVMMNSDLTYPPKHVETMHLLLKHVAPVVIGSRSLVERGAMPFVNSVGNSMLSALASALYGRHIWDLCSGRWGFRTEVLKSFSLTSVGFSLEADLFICTVKGKHPWAQIPIGYRARLDGDRPKLRVADGLKIGSFLVQRRFKK